jgi:hypothetical protein
MLAVIASIVIIVLVLAPGAASLLIFLACPLMMIFMMGGMGMDHSKHAMPGNQSSPAGQIQESEGNQQGRQIRQLQGQIQELQQAQVALREQLKQAEAINPTTSISINPESISINPEIEAVGETSGKGNARIR